MTHLDLLDLVYRFYPRGIVLGASGYNDTVERRRQREVARRAVAEYPTWKAMLRRLGTRYPTWDHSVCVLGKSYLEGSYDPGYSADIKLPGHRLGFHVSLLGPYYGIHRTGAPGEAPAALDLAREIEATYPGYEAIPPALGNELVPEVVYCGKTTIYICLLSPDWEWSSPTDDGARSRDYVEPPHDPGATDEPPAPEAIAVGRDLPTHWKDRRD